MIKNSSQVRDRIITTEEESRIVTLLRSPELNHRKSYFSDVADLVEVLIDTGMRTLEFQELTYKDVKFENNIIFIRATKGNSRRIPMTNRVAAILKRRQELDQHKPFNLNSMQVTIAWTWVRDQMGLKDDKGFVLYALRRTCAFRLVDAGVRMDIVQDWLGYSSIRAGRRFKPLTPQKLNEASVMLEKYNLSQHQ